jgi:hypothetical protein
VLDQGIDTSTAVGRMFFHILGAIAEFEHALMLERTRDGLAAARARGRTGGQRAKLTARQAKIARQMYDEKGPDGRRRYTVQQIAEEFAVTPPHNLSPPASHCRQRLISRSPTLTDATTGCRPATTRWLIVGFALDGTSIRPRIRDEPLQGPT